MQLQLLVLIAVLAVCHGFRRHHRFPRPVESDESFDNSTETGNSTETWNSTDSVSNEMYPSAESYENGGAYYETNLIVAHLKNTGGQDNIKQQQYGDAAHEVLIENTVDYKEPLVAAAVDIPVKTEVIEEEAGEVMVGPGTSLTQEEIALTNEHVGSEYQQAGGLAALAESVDTIATELETAAGDVKTTAGDGDVETAAADVADAAYDEVTGETTDGYYDDAGVDNNVAEGTETDVGVEVGNKQKRHFGYPIGWGGMYGGFPGWGGFYGGFGGYPFGFGGFWG